MTALLAQCTVSVGKLIQRVIVWVSHRVTCQILQFSFFVLKHEFNFVLNAYAYKEEIRKFWPTFFNTLAPELFFFLILAHPVYKM